MAPVAIVLAIVLIAVVFFTSLGALGTFLAVHVIPIAFIAVIGLGRKMTPEEFQEFYPPLLNWLRATLTAHAGMAQAVASRAFSRLPLYFSKETLASTKVVLVNWVPRPPLSKMGLTRFVEFERGDLDGITYLDTFFLKQAHSKNEAIHFHELIHVVQWRLLGPDRFLYSYANGLERFGYRQSPLEVMAYDAERMFATSITIFDAEKLVAEKLAAMAAGITGGMRVPTL